jgi:hypothetical protein
MSARSLPIRPSFAVGLYALLSCGVTWPLVLHFTTRLPLDLGDPLLNAWILAWDWSRLLQLAHGDLAGLLGFWNADIFYPHPLALAYSEHLFTQAVLGLPAFVLTRNAILGYNVVFLSTFALSGLGAFLFVRQVTGDARAALVGGLLYAFAPYRLTQVGHLQVMSSQWMPFVLYGVARWFDGFAASDAVARAAGGWPPLPRRAPLWWAAVALVAQNLSCGYYLFFFTPLAAGNALWEIYRRRLWSNPRMWRSLAAAAAVVVVATVPFLLPYAELRRQGFNPRPLEEVQRYSADVYSYLRPVEDSLWSRWLTDYTREEGVLSPGSCPSCLRVRRSQTRFARRADGTGAFRPQLAG